MGQKGLAYVEHLFFLLLFILTLAGFWDRIGDVGKAIVIGLGIIVLSPFLPDILLSPLFLWWMIFPPRWVSLYDSRTGEELVRLAGPRGDQWITSLSFSPDSKLLAGSGTDEHVYIWSIPGGERVSKFRGIGWLGLTLVFSRDDRFLIGGHGEEPIKYWDPESGRLIKEVRAKGYMTCLATSPDRTGTAGGSIAVREADSERVIARLSGGVTGDLKTIAVSPDGSFLAASVKNNGTGALSNPFCLNINCASDFSRD